MIVYPHAKINIGLSVTGKRSDGFHDIETVFYPIQLCDIMEINLSPCPSPQERGVVGKLRFTCDGFALPGDEQGDNLCCRAYHLLDAAGYSLPPVDIHLHKGIPVGAGLGGGSSDATYTLLALNDLFQLQIPDEELVKHASRLGSDCAFFLHRSPAFATGKGDILEPLSLSLAEYHIIAVTPPVFVSTAEAYKSAVPRKTTSHLPELLQAPVDEWRHTVFNDFENTVFKKFPETGRIKEKLYRAGAVYASMSGSGSSVYGIFRESPEDIAAMFPGCFLWNSGFPPGAVEELKIEIAAVNNRSFHN